jgi:hypothetical protein
MVGRTRTRSLASLIAAGSTEDEVRALISEQHTKLLPAGVTTPGHRFVWICSPTGTLRARFGQAEIVALAAACRTADRRRLGLTVATGNARAVAAYRSAGFVTRP